MFVSNNLETIDIEWQPLTEFEELPSSDISVYVFDPTFDPFGYSQAKHVLKFQWECVDEENPELSQTLTANFIDGELAELYEADTRLWTRKQ
uniref:Uncharacterized protein n=1 Tax=Panagrolaimus sp. JU765 TaxID=591449 RepID=A0AC34Q8E1_9BILA